MHMHCSSGSRTSAQMRNSEVSKRANRFPFLTRSALDLADFPKWHCRQQSRRSDELRFANFGERAKKGLVDAGFQEVFLRSS
jgi:hypothetical protein